MAQTQNAAYYAEVRARAQARAKEDPSIVPHGTPSGYSYWGCRCGDCSARNNRRQQAWYAGRKARMQDGAA